MNRSRSPRRVAARLLLLAASVPALQPPPAAAQAPLALGPGSRMRVSLEGVQGRFVGTLVAASADTLVLAYAPPARVTLPLAVSDITKLEVSAGRRSLVAVGAAAGVIAGALLTGSYNRVVATQCFRECPEGFPVLAGAAIGGLAVGGGLAFVRPERWLEISIPGRSATSPAVSRGGS